MICPAPTTAASTTASSTPMVDAALGQAMDNPMVRAFLGQLEAKVNAFCARTAATAGAKPDGACCSGCANGQSCEANCPGTPPAFSLPECYGECDAVSKCLMQFYKDARLRTDMAAWIEYNKQEIPLVHINVSVGAGPNYNPVIPPVVAGQRYMLMQEPAQWLPYEPGFFKLDLTWTGGPAANQAVQINIYTGDYSVQSVTSTPQAAGLVQVGRTFSLSDFTSSPADSGGGCCWFLPYPKIFGCKEYAIPNQRRVFIEVIGTANMGPSQLSQFNIALVKRHTDKFGELCSQFKLSYK